MAVSILTITHGNVGKELLATAETMLRKLPLRCETLSVSNQCNPDELLLEAQAICKKIESMVMEFWCLQIYSAPHQAISATNLKDSINIDIHVIAGLNLPMLIRVLNYPKLNLNELVDKALSGAHDGIIDCQLNN